MFDRAQPGHGQLLLAFAPASERGVVGLHDQQLRAGVDSGAHEAVVGHLEADDITDGDVTDGQDPGCGAVDEVVGHLGGEPAD